MPMRDADSDGFDYRDLDLVLEDERRSDTRLDRRIDRAALPVLSDEDQANRRPGADAEDRHAAALVAWAERYDELNGAPENDDDR